MTPPQSYTANLYRRIKRRVECSLRGTHCKGNLVSSRKQVTYKLFGTKNDLSGSKNVPRPMLEQDNIYSNRQYRSGCLYRQGWRHEVRPTVCPSVENPDLVFQETGNTQGPTHSTPVGCGIKLSRLGQTIQTEWSILPNIFQLICSRWHQPHIFIYYEVQQQTASLCVTRPSFLGYQCL